MRCPAGHENASGKFCSECGAPLESSATPPTPPGAPTEGVPPASWSSPAGPPAEWAGTTTTSPSGSSSKGGRSTTPIILAITAVVVILGSAVAALVGLGVLGDEGTETITGSITLFDIGGVEGGLTSCHGTGGYSDIDAGMDVTVRDAEGKIVGSSSVRNMSEAEVRELLREDEEQSDAESSGSSDADAEDMLDVLDGSACPLAFEVEVAKVDFYEIKIGRRGELSASRKELEDDDWTVEYSIGD